MVERAVEMVCSYMPGSVADRCIDFVADYGDEIIRLIVELELPPREVCAALTLCAEPPAVEDDRVEDVSGELYSIVIVGQCDKLFSNMYIVICNYYRDRLKGGP